MAAVKDSGFEALEKLKSTEPPVFLAPSSISEVARAASQYLFTKLKPHNPKSPFDELLVDGFDAEQIWQQIDMQSQPLLSSLRHEVKRFAKSPKEIRKIGDLAVEASHEGDVDEMDMDDDNDVEDDDDELEADESEGEEEEEDGEDEEEEEEEEEENEGIEDKFFKIKDLEDFLEEGEAQEYGTDYKNKKGLSKGKNQNLSDDDDDYDEEDEEDEDEEDEEVTHINIAQEYKIGLNVLQI